MFNLFFSLSLFPKFYFNRVLTACIGKKTIGSHIHTASLYEYDPKMFSESPKFSVFNKISQKFGSPTQKLDFAKSLKSSYDRSRREKSESISAISLHTRASLINPNNFNTVRNASWKTRNDSVNDKTIGSNTSKTEKTSQPAARSNPKGQQSEFLLYFRTKDILYFFIVSQIIPLSLFSLWFSPFTKDRFIE